MPENFAVLTSARSGSGWLIDTIKNHPSLTGYGELFNTALHRNLDDIPEFIFSDEYGQGRRPASVRRYLDRYICSQARTGFKLLYGHVRAFPEVLAFMRSRGWQMIHLVRRNQLDVLISSEIVYQKTGKWTVRNGTGIPSGDLQIRIDTASLERQLERKYRLIRTAGMALKLLRFDHLHLEYEEICRDQGQFDRVWNFLGVDEPSAGPQSDLVKVQTRMHSQVIENFEEVRAALDGTRFRKLLQPG
jgi:hypothetical protein